MTAATPSRLRTRLQAAFRENPSEPGTDHPKADGIISALASTPQDIAELTAVAIDREGDDPHTAWDTLIRIAHADLRWPGDAKAGLIRQALQSPNIMVRDGAVQVAEAWDEPFIMGILKAHQEPHERLAAYVSEVISEQKKRR